MGLQLSVLKDLGGFRLDVSWEVGNELVVLFGYSGAGKSTTFQMIAGLIQPDYGSILLNGRVLYDSEANVNLAPRKRHLGYLFQDLALFPHMTVRQNVLYGASGCSREEKEDAAEGMLRRFGMLGLSRKFPGQISGGQKQRVALARALAGHPQALLLDEPFSALDMPVRRDMRDMVMEIQREFQVPVILVTHDADEAEAIADRMIVYSSGRVLRIGTPGEILVTPACDRAEALVYCGEGQASLPTCSENSGQELVG
jgi:molybdate transport system ATP-binding protein